MVTGAGLKSEAELSTELQEKGWHNIKKMLETYAEGAESEDLNCNFATCGQKTCILCMGIDARKRYWEPLGHSIGTTVTQIAEAYEEQDYDLVRYDGNNFGNFINKWCEMLRYNAMFRKQLSHAGFIFSEPQTIIRDLLGENQGTVLELMEVKAVEGRIRFVRAHYDMGNSVYGRWLQEQGLRQAMGETKAGDMVEALLSFNWWQERAESRLDMMGNMAFFHRELQEMLQGANLRYQAEEQDTSKMSRRD